MACNDNQSIIVIIEHLPDLEGHLDDLLTVLKVVLLLFEFIVELDGLHFDEVAVEDKLVGDRLGDSCLLLEKKVV